jgi:hypothetical protein
MRAVTDDEIRDAFINCTKGEAQRVPMPRDLEQTPWEDLDFLGWRDLGAPDRGYLIAERDGALVGITLRASSSQRGFLHRSMCSLCYTTHSGSGVSLMAARKAGTAGRQGNSVGLYICSDLACPLYIRGKKQPGGAGVRFEETLSVEEQLWRMTAKLSEFLDKLVGVGG